MFTLLSILIEVIFWILLFLCPFLIFGIISSIIYFKFDNMILAVIIGNIGILSGIIFAEKIRRKYGTSNFFGRLLRTPELEDKNSSNNSAI